MKCNSQLCWSGAPLKRKASGWAGSALGRDSDELIFYIAFKTFVEYRSHSIPTYYMS